MSELHDTLADAFEGFRADALPTITAPGPDAVRSTVRRRRQRNRAVGIAAVAVVAALGVGVALAAAGGPVDRIQPADPPTVSPSVTSSPSASASPSPTPSASKTPNSLALRGVSWRSATVPVPASMHCPGGRITFSGGTADVGGYHYSVLSHGAQPAYGDLNGDGREDVLLGLTCSSNDDLGDALIAVTAEGTNLHAIGAIGLRFSTDEFRDYRVVDGVVHTTVVATDGPGSQNRRYRWNGSAFEQIGGPTAFPTVEPTLDVTTFDWQNATLDLPFRGPAARVEPNGESCPRIRATFREGSATASGCTYRIDAYPETSADLDGDGGKDVLIQISAGHRLRNSWFFAYTVRRNAPVLVGFVTGGFLPNSAPSQAYDMETVGWRVTAGRPVLDQFMLDGAQHRMVTRSFTWNGGGFTPSQAPPLARADDRP